MIIKTIRGEKIMPISQEYMSKLQTLQTWENRVSNMKSFTIPERYELDGVKGKYERFTGFIEMWITEAFQHTDDVVSDDESLMQFGRLELDMSKIKDDWFKHAQDVATGKATEIDLPTTKDPATDVDKKIIYDTFLPAYRAIKERFEKRSFWQFIFNHAQYTAERDALRAIEGVVTTLTGEGKAGLEAAYAQYKEELPSTNITDAIVHESNRVFIEKAEQIDAERAEQAEKERELQIVIEEEKQKEKEEIMAKSASELTCYDQAKILFDDEGFQKSTASDFLSAVEKSKFMAKNTLIKPMLYTPLTTEAIRFNQKYDNYVADESSKEEIESMVADQVKAMYKVAFTKLMAFKLDLKDRIVAAQKITDIMLNSATPVGFKQNEYGKYANNYALKNDECVREAISANGIALDDNALAAINDAKIALDAFDKEKVQISEAMDAPNAGEKSEKVDAPVKDAVEKSIG